MAKTTMELRLVCLMLLAVQSVVIALDNGLALIPPLGFHSWERFRCNTDCDKDPDFCISEKLFMQIADVMVNDTYRDAGYNIITIADCWMASERQEDGTLIADTRRFPNGMKYLADYVHEKGMKLGLFQSLGEKTCNGNPGISEYLDLDARTFADWGIDHVELDACNVRDQYDLEKGYTAMGQFLKQTGRPMTYTCHWPLNLIKINVKPDYAKIAKVCTMWRFTDDIQDSFSSVEKITDAFGDDISDLSSIGGPGQWNHPDSLILGNFGLSYDQARTQLGIWTVLAAPFMISADLRCMKKEFKDLYLNKFVIAIDEDVLGLMPRRYSKENGLEIWLVALTPTVDSYLSFCIAFVNRRTNGVPSTMTVQLREMGLNFTGNYQLTNAFTYEDLGDYVGNDQITIKVNPTGTFLLHARVRDPRKRRGLYNPKTGKYDSGLRQKKTPTNSICKVYE